MAALARAYDSSVRLLRRISPVFEQGSSKLALGIRGRIAAGDTLRDWSEVYRDEGRALVWVHAPSVGEGLQAKAVLDALLERRPDLQAAFTFFSPSAAGFARKMPVHVAGYLPWDIRSEMDETLDHVDPGLLVFTKTEVWPGLTAAAVARGVPVVLAAATLSEDSGRLGFLGRTVLGPSFRALTRVLAIADEDGERFERLGVAPERIRVTGDPAVDSAWARAREANPKALHLAPLLAEDRPTIVAGSTWWEDDRVLLSAMAEVRSAVPGLRLVIAPHEPREAALAHLEGALAAAGFATARLGDIEAKGKAEGVDAVLVDRVGVLAHLYTAGDVAFVGGGFGRRGLHSVLEPAAAGVPVLFGPRGHSRAARDLVRGGGAKVVSNARDLAGGVGGWLRDRRKLEEAADRASGYIEGHRGAAGRTAAALLDLLPPASGAGSGAEAGPAGAGRTEVSG